MAKRFMLFVPVALLAMGLNRPMGFADSGIGTASPPPPQILTAQPPPLSSASAPAQAPPPPEAPPPSEAPPAEAQAPETPPAEEPAPSQKAPSTEEIIVSNDEPVPGAGFGKLPATWAFRFAFSPSALGGSDVTGGQMISSKGLTVGFEYEPRFLQGFGTLAFGPSLDLYPVLPVQPGVQTTPFTNYGYGGEIRYQCQFSRDQWIVPELAYDIEHVTLQTVAGGSGSLALSGIEGGIYILLNPFEPSQAFELYKDSGVVRTYLTAEVRALDGSTNAIAIAGTSYYFGLRAEY